MSDEELKELVASLAVSQHNTEKLFKELSEKMRQTDERIDKIGAKLEFLGIQTDEQMKKTDTKLELSGIQTDERIDKIGAKLELSGIQTDERIDKIGAKLEFLGIQTDEQMKKTDTKLERMGIQLGNLNQNIGMTTEEYFYNSLYDNPMLGNIRFDSISKNLHSKTKKLEDEYDIVMYNGNSIGIVECKFKAHENDLHKLIQTKTRNFRELFPDYRDFDIYLGLASFCFYPELEKLAFENGVALLKQKGDVMQIEVSYLKAY